MLNRPKPLVLLILDGFGYSLEKENNAIAMVNTPCWDHLQKDYPTTLLDCSGRSVGLPHEQMGNSEVRHIHIGTGRYVPQDFSKINDAIEDGSFFINPVFCRAVDLAKDKGKALHIIGLLFSGVGVADSAPTMLAILGVEQPAEMTGRSLVNAA